MIINYQLYVTTRKDQMVEDKIRMSSTEPRSDKVLKNCMNVIFSIH